MNQLKFTVIDLFSGAGGLSYGFMQEGHFKIAAAFENVLSAQKTYQKNHPDVQIYPDVCEFDYAAIERKFGRVDVVIGGPPCQGFSNANRQKNHTISKNNSLIKEYVRAILELKPKAFVLENVSMLRSDVHRFFLTAEEIGLADKFNIPVAASEILLLADVFRFESAKYICENQDILCKYLLENKSYDILNILYRQRNNETKFKKTILRYSSRIFKICEELLRSSTGDGHIDEANKETGRELLTVTSGQRIPHDLIKHIEITVMIQRMLQKAKEIYDNDLVIDKISDDNGVSMAVRSAAVFDYISSTLKSNECGYALDSGILCAASFGVPQKRNRFVIMGIRKDISTKIDLPKPKLKTDEYNSVYDAISDIESIPAIVKIESDLGIPISKEQDQLTDLARQLRNSNVLFNHVITETRPIAMQRFRALKQGENFHNLNEDLKKNTYTNANRTQNTIYSRLKYNEPSGTVVNVRKSMWVHPVLDRAISIREAARLQTFPDSFIFIGTKDSQYQQVGNAVPPFLAKAIADQLYHVLAKSPSEE